MDTCQHCGRTRRDGWLIVEGTCRDCDERPFLDRLAVLREQARKLLDEERAG